MRVGPKYKICRRLGDPVFGKCQTGKFAISDQKKKMTGRRPRPRSEYGTQLLEKQKVRYTYGLTERALSNYVSKAQGRTGVSPVASLFTTLESRLDNVVFRLGFANTRAFARQLVSHGHILVNGTHLTIPSHQIRKGDVISIRTQSRVKPVFATVGEKLKEYNPPKWLALDLTQYQGTVLDTPGTDEQTGTVNLNEIIGFYSRV